MTALAIFLLLTAVLFAAMLVLLMSNHDSHGEQVWRQEVLAALQDIRKYTAGTLLVASDIRDLLKRHFILTRARTLVMPKTVNVGDSFHCAINGLDQNGSPFTLDATYKVVYSSSNPATASFDPPGPDGSCVGHALAADTGDSISAVITRPDGVQVTASADTLIVNATPPPPVLTTASVVLS